MPPHLEFLKITIFSKAKPEHILAFRKKSGEVQQNNYNEIVMS